MKKILDDNEIFRFSVSKVSEAQYIGEGLYAMNAKAQLTFSCPCDECRMTVVATMQGVINDLKKEHGISDDAVTTHVQKMGGDLTRSGSRLH